MARFLRLTRNEYLITLLFALLLASPAQAQFFFFHTVGNNSSGGGPVTVQRVQCWGGALNGRLGNGSTTPAQPSPVLLAGGFDTTSWKSVHAADAYTCAIRASDNRIYCWGANASGQLGNGGTTEQTSPGELTSTGGWNTTAWSTLSAGTNHVCAIRASDDRMFCWGGNTSGQLGTGDTLPSSAPKALSSTGGWDMTAWKSVSVGNVHTCAIRLSDNQILCWGGNTGGQLGFGDASTSNTPRPLATSGGWDAIAWKSVHSGYTFTCGIRLSDDRIFCWGTNTVGQLGTGDTTTPNNSPRALASAGGWDTASWKSMSTGSSHACAVKTDDTLYCWGSGTSGQLGNAGNVSNSTPQAVSGGATWASVATGVQHSCGLRTSGSLYCWGSGANGRLGNGNLTGDEWAPVQVGSSTSWSSVSVTNLHACARQSYTYTPTNTQTFTVSGPWVVPTGVTSITVELWGGGGGGTVSGSIQGGGGGGGGFSRKVLTVTPASSLSVVVGAGGTAGVNGTSSTVSAGGPVLAEATGGQANGAASPPPSGPYDVFYPGGTGAAAQGGGGSRAGSGGGGAGGTSASGQSGSLGATTAPGAGGFGGPEGGVGGIGGAPNAAGANGSFPGGGGGGKGSGAGVNSGSGGNGYVRITY